MGAAGERPEYDIKSPLAASLVILWKSGVVMFADFRMRKITQAA